MFKTSNPSEPGSSKKPALFRPLLAFALAAASVGHVAATIVFSDGLSDGSNWSVVADPDTSAIFDNVSIDQVPEAGTGAAALLGLGALLLRRRRKFPHAA